MNCCLLMGWMCKENHHLKLHLCYKGLVKPLSISQSVKCTPVLFIVSIYSPSLNNIFVCCLYPLADLEQHNSQVKHGDCGPIETISIQRQQSIAKSPVFYQLEQVKNGSSSVGYVRVKEFNALATKDLITGIVYIVSKLFQFHILVIYIFF